MAFISVNYLDEVNMKTRIFGLATLSACVLTVVIGFGCGEDNGGTTPETDSTPPATTTNLAVLAVSDSSITLTWTAPGDDGDTGTATQYDLRYSTSSLAEGGWTSAHSVSGLLSPQIAGTGEELAISGLTAGTSYYIGLKTADEVPNWSGLSNVVWDTTSVIEYSGIIIIDQTPGTLAGAGWTLSGPQNQTGSGDMTLTCMFVGDYTMTWSAVSGYSTPSTETQTLAAGSVVTFSGTYSENNGSGGFVQIPTGTFTMGSPTIEPSRESDESQHTVTLTTPFEMFATEVTNQQYADLAQWAYGHGYCTATSSSLRDALDGSTQEVLDLDSSDCEISFSGDTFIVDAGKDNHPVLEVSWYGAVAYCDWLSLQAGLTRAYDHSTWLCNGNDPYSAVGYRLPTEAEWEYACRAGTQTPFNTGDCLDAGTEANYNGSYPYTGCPSGPYAGWTVPVGSYPVNAFDFYDMHGNVYEWCNDWYGPYAGDEADPVGSGTGSYRVIRGGRWVYFAQYCRSAYRHNYYPSFSSYWIGFRPARSTN